MKRMSVLSRLGAPAAPAPAPDLVGVLQYLAESDPMDALSGVAELSTVATVSPAGVHFTYDGLGDDAEDPRTNEALSMWRGTIKDTV
jgi:hypothetical protein